MKSVNFLPIWYREKINRKNNFKILIIAGVIIIGIVLNVVKFINCRDAIKDIEILTENKILIRNKNFNKKSKLSKKKSDVVENYYNFISYIDNKCLVNSIKISKDEIFIEKKYNFLKEVCDFIKFIEKNKKYEIKNINMGNIKGDEGYLKIYLKKKSHD